MGMYTQVRGWLNVDSISYRHGEQLEVILSTAKADFAKFCEGKSIRRWVKDDVILHNGSNGCAFIFIGSELKNYDQDAQTWIKFLLPYFPNAEGLIYFQYEDTEDNENTVWTISHGKVIKEEHMATVFKGYGNQAEYVEDSHEL